MKLSELHPCDHCGGPLLKPPMAVFYVVRVTQAMPIPKAANEVLGLTTMFNGALGLAEVMAPDPNGAVMVLGDEQPALMTNLLLCFDCAFGPVNLLALMEKRAEQKQQGDTDG